MDWHELFGVQVPLQELVLRGTCMYWFLFVLFRFVARRDIDGLGIADVLVLLIVADAAQNAFSGGYQSLTEGAALVSTIVGWNLLLNWICYRWPRFDRLMKAPPLPLVRHGRVLRRNLSRELLTMDDLTEELHHHGIERLEDVRHAFLESDGKVSVIPNRP
jgi:uncharacterized membrane protein YcaP (DUF421 family)